MSIQEQLAYSQSHQIPVPFPLTDYVSLRGNIDEGMLANVSVQVVSFSPDRLNEVYERTFGKAFAPARLFILKQQKFTNEGRNARIAASLAALNAPQPIDLPIETWKSILKEVEDED